MDFELSSSSSSDEGQWSPSSSPVHQEMDATDRLSHSNKKRSLDHSSDDDDDPEGGASDNESVDDHRNDAPIDSSTLLSLSTAKSSRTRRVVGLAMSRLSELERIKQGRKFTAEESREYKKLKRQRQNRDAAANSRKKKKQKLDSLEELVNGFKRQNDELIAKLTEALKENQSLKEALEAFKKQANTNTDNNATNSNTVKEEAPSTCTVSSPPSSSPSVCSSVVSSLSDHSVPTVGRLESFINHSVESAWLYTNNAVLKSIQNHAENIVNICCPAG